MGLAQGMRPDDVPHDQRLHESVAVSGIAGGQRIQAQKGGWDYLGDGEVKILVNGNSWYPEILGYQEFFLNVNPYPV